VVWGGILRVAVYWVKGTTIAVWAWTDPEEVEASRFQDNQHMKVIRLSALITGCFCSLGNIPGTHFC